MPSSPPLNVYFAGEMFSLKHLYGNAALAEMIYELSDGRFIPTLPQNLEQRETTSQDIRDQDLKAVLSCDVGVFHYDGSDLDSGTVVEYLFAKFADIPCVLVRTDFRFSGDPSNYPWNPMTSYFPRTEVIVLNGKDLYQECLDIPTSQPAADFLRRKSGSEAARQATGIVARQVIAAMEKVVSLPPILPRQTQREIYGWLAQMPGFQENLPAVQEKFAAQLERKVEKGLL